MRYGGIPPWRALYSPSRVKGAWVRTTHILSAAYAWPLPASRSCRLAARRFVVSPRLDPRFRGDDTSWLGQARRGSCFVSSVFIQHWPRRVRYAIEPISLEVR